MHHQGGPFWTPIGGPFTAPIDNRAGEVTRSVAEALSLATRDQQKVLLESLRSDMPPDAEDIRSTLLGRKPTLSMAIFERERYTGTITTDLFGDEETTYFDDVDQFLALQREAVEALAEERRKTAVWVEVLYLYTVPWWQFRDAAEGEPSGVVINLHPSGAVEIREGLIRHVVETTVREATRDSPFQPRQPSSRPAFNAELIRYAACQRSAAVQAVLLANPRKAKEAGVLLLLVGFHRDFGMRLRLHGTHAVSVDAKDQASYRRIDGAITPLIAELGLSGDREADVNHRDVVSVLLDDIDTAAIQSGIRRLSDDALDRLMVLLPILSLGQDHLDAIDAGDSLFNRIAADIGVDVRAWWRPDSVFLSLLTREQLLQVAADIGVVGRLKGMNGWTKKRLVDELAACFANQSDGDADDHRAANMWLPGLLRFPAVKALFAEAL
jgi:ParB family chromosome partitioning protein